MFAIYLTKILGGTKLFLSSTTQLILSTIIKCRGRLIGFEILYIINDDDGKARSISRCDRKPN